MTNHNSQHTSILLTSLNASDKDVLNKYLIYSIDYNKENLPFKIDKYFGNLEYILNHDDDDDLVSKLYTFNVLINDYEFKISILFEILIYKSQPIVILEDLNVYYDIPRSIIKYSKNEAIIAKLNPFQLNLTHIDTSTEFKYEIVYQEQGNKFSIDYNTGILRTNSANLDENSYSMKILVRNSTKSNKIIYLIINVFMAIHNDEINVRQNEFFLKSQNETFLLFQEQEAPIKKVEIIFQEYQNLFIIDKFTNKIWCTACEKLDKKVFNVILVISTVFNKSQIVFIQFFNNQSTISSNILTESVNSVIDLNGEVKNLELTFNENIELGTLILDFNLIRNYTNIFQTMYHLNSTNSSTIYFYFNNGQLILKRKFDYELENVINLQILCIQLSGTHHLQLNIKSIYNLKLKITKFNNHRPQFAFNNFKFNLNINDLELNKTEKFFIDYIKAYNKYSQSSILYYLQSYDETMDDYLNNDNDLIQGYVESSRSLSIQNNDNNGK